jgi:hypothetical protein
MGASCLVCSSSPLTCEGSLQKCIPAQQPRETLICRATLSLSLTCARVRQENIFQARHTLELFITHRAAAGKRRAHTPRRKKQLRIRWGEKNATQIFPQARRTQRSYFFLANFIICFRYYAALLSPPQKDFGVSRIQWAPKTQIYARLASTGFSFEVSTTYIQLSGY